MEPAAPPKVSKGTAVRPIMDGRYFVTDVTGHMKMPGADGKMKHFDFKGMSIEGYDNVQRIRHTWGHNMGTGIMMSTGATIPPRNPSPTTPKWR